MQSENSALNSQEGGDHYKKLGHYQPWEVLSRWLAPQELKGFAKGTVIAYLAREEDKGGRLDIKKAMHTLQLYLELSEETEEVLKEKEARQPTWKVMSDEDKAMMLKALTSTPREERLEEWSHSEYSTVEQEVSEFLSEEERKMIDTAALCMENPVDEELRLKVEREPGFQKIIENLRRTRQNMVCPADASDEELRLKAERDREAAFPAAAVPPRSGVTSSEKYDGSDFW